ALLAVYGLRHGLDQRSAVVMLSVFTGGNVLMQMPIGWIADHTSRRAVMMVCVLLSLAGALALPFAVTTLVPLYLLMFLWGGAVFAIYTVGVGLVGDGVCRPELVAAYVGLVLLYQLRRAQRHTLRGSV